MRKTGQVVPCKYCGKDFYLPKWEADRGGKYCSHACHSKDLIKPRIGVICRGCGKRFMSTQCEVKRGHGKFCSKQCSIPAAIRAAVAKVKRTPESQQSRWKGDKVGYFGVHDWMTKHYGQPIGCETCGTIDPSKTYGWANISKTYKRDRNDFKRMCMSCHRIYDGAGKKAWATFLRRKELKESAA